jgi:putative hydrolase of the HAD superfamily
MLLTDFDALTFDCYGTLIDWESGMVEALKGLSDRAQRPLTRDQILEAHARHESSQQPLPPKAAMSRDLLIVTKRLSRSGERPRNYARDCIEYGRAVGYWPAFEDSPGALQYLKKYFKLVILSNVDNETFQASNRRLQVEFDAIYTAEDIGSYKPSVRNFEYMIEKLEGIGVKREKILHTAESMFHDHKPANDHGLKSCWIYRRNAQQGFGATMNPGQMPHVDFKFNSMHELVKAHREQLRVK